MIQTALQLGMIGFDIIRAWLKHDLGAADYRIVRVVFFSALAAWAAFWIARTTMGLAYGTMRLIMLRIPQGILALSSNVARDIEASLGRISQEYREWVATKKRPGQGL